MGIWYLLIALIATIVGGFTGIGGGIIIKPVLDAVSSYSGSTINILSSVTVFFMALVAVFRNMQSGFKISRNIVILAIGSILGGLIGKEALFLVTSTMIDKQVVFLQSGILIALLVVVLLKSKIKPYYTENIAVIALIGIFLGSTASFLGVGGGPINIFILHLFIKMEVKERTVSSIFVILLSQFAMLTSITLTSGFGEFDLSMLYYMVPAGILGGLIGSYLLRKCQVKHIGIVFNSVVFLIIGISVFNIICVL